MRILLSISFLFVLTIIHAGSINFVGDMMFGQTKLETRVFEID